MKMLTMQYFQMDLLPNEMADPEQWDIQVWDSLPGQNFYFTQRFLQWDTADKFNRPLYWSDVQGGPKLPANWKYNASAVPFPQLSPDETYPYTDYDVEGVYAEGFNGSGSPGLVAVPAPDAVGRTWVFQEDGDGNGGLHTFLVKASGSKPAHSAYTLKINPCPTAGCPPPPPPLREHPPRSSSRRGASLRPGTTPRHMPLTRS